MDLPNKPAIINLQSVLLLSHLSFPVLSLPFSQSVSASHISFIVGLLLVGLAFTSTL